MTGFSLEELKQMDRNALWHPYTKHSGAAASSFPMIVRGEGIYLYDHTGARYLDAIASWWCCNLGHNHPDLVRALTEQAGLLQHSILGNMSHPCAATLAARLVSLFPDKKRKVHFAGDGSCAVEAALKIAIQYWHALGERNRIRFVSLAGDYHGDTLGAVSVGYVEKFHRQFKEAVVPSFQAEAPCCSACAYGKTPASCSLECFASIRAIVAQHAAAIAAVIVEPLCQGAAGMRMYSPKYLSALSALCKEQNVLLIVDEIAMGFGRTGRMFAFEHAAIDPDIVCIGKGLTGGYLPMSAVVVRDFIYDVFADGVRDNTFYHGHTFSGNPLAAAVACEVLAVYERDRIVEQVDRKSRILASSMARFADLPGVSDVRCLGLIGAVELNDATGIKAGAVRRELLKNHILVRPLGNVIYLMPPLIISDEQLTEAIDCLYFALTPSGR
jgi:adenosylmethionine-8-amino-7-oxononanoate aminotransferase